MNLAAYYGNIGRGVGQGVEFARAGSFDELYSLLRKAGRVKGLIRTYSADQAIALIEDVRNCKVSINRVPKTGGLQETVIRLTNNIEGAPIDA